MFIMDTASSSHLGVEIDVVFYGGFSFLFCFENAETVFKKQKIPPSPGFPIPPATASPSFKIPFFIISLNLT